ncbi:MAG TPA: Ig-like domain-containing protein, partial [Petrotogaceae bacterium]|nr:Ig-like domain-containing protein [Petrotogaceae bacterium]
MKKNLIVLFVVILSLALVLTSCMVDKDPEINVTDQSVLEGDTLTVDLSTKVTDPEGKPITITKVSGVGTLTGKVYTYTPSFSDAGVKEVTLKASDGKREVQKTFK